MPPESFKTWKFGPFVFEQAKSELSRDGVVVAIEPQSLRLLAYLIENKDRVISRQELVEVIWFGRAISDWAVSGAIKALRLALQDTDVERLYVRTVHSRGYRFVHDVIATADVAPSELTPTLLVRVLRTHNDEPELAYLAEGLTEDLIARLSSGKNRRVLSYNTAHAIADMAPPDHLGITAVVDGSLRQIGATIRITVALLDAEGVHQTWAENFDLTQDSLLAAHDLIADKLDAVLCPRSAEAKIQPRGTQNSQAYDHYQKGRYAYYRYDPMGFVDALSHFTRATELDPSYADAYAQQAYCRTTLYLFGLPQSDKSLDAVEALARKAIAMDPQSALGYARLGWVLGYCNRAEETVSAFERAVRLAPDSAEVYHAYGETMNRLARPEDAAPLLDAVFSKDSYLPPSWEFPQGHTQLLRGQSDVAIGHFKSVLSRVERFVPAHVQLVRALWQTGARAEAVETVQTIKSIAPKYSVAHATRMFPYPEPQHITGLIGALRGAGMQE